MTEKSTSPSHSFQLPTPISACVLAVAIFGSFHLISPFSFAHSFQYTTWLFLIVNFIALGAPAFFHQIRSRYQVWVVPATTGFPKDLRLLKAAVWLLIGLSLIGALLKSYDLFYARGFSMEANVNELYEQNAATSASISGLLSSLLYPLAFPALTVSIAIHHCEHRRNKISWKLAILCCLFAGLVAPLNSVLLGKRGAVFSVTILTALAFFYSGIRLRTRTVGLAVITAFTLVLFSAQMLNHRLELGGGSAEKAVEVGRFTDLLEMGTSFRLATRHSGIPESVRSSIYDWATFHAYVIHGIPEYLYAVENFNSAEHQYGRYTFALVAKFFSYFTDLHYDAQESSQVPPRTRVYTTLFGPLFFDFGYASLAVSVVIGVAFVILFRVARVDATMVPLYLYFYALIALSPMICFLNLFYGFYYLVGCCAGFAFLALFKRVRLKT